MANTYFDFKQFRIHQEGSAMKVGTDGVLLGAWADISKASRILDIGTGTGLIAIMMAQRTQPTTKIDGVEIESSSYQQAVNNFAKCSWTSRLNVFHLPFQDFCQVNQQKYDAIVSNPPFFLNGLKANNKSRTQARHADHLPFGELLTGAFNQLTEAGSLSLILPVEEGEYFVRLARLTGFWLKRKCAVLPNPGKPAKRFLLEFSLQQCEPQYSELVVENGQRHVYSPDYIELTKEFYLKF